MSLAALMVTWGVAWAGAGGEGPAPEGAPAADEAAPAADEAAPDAPALDEGEARPAEEEPAYPVLWSGQCEPDDPHYDLEVLYHQGRYDEGLASCERRLGDAPDDADAAWMAARFLFEIGERFERDDPSVDKEAHYQRMLEVSNQGLAARPGDPHLRFARGIARGRLGTTRGVLASLWMAKDVEADWLAVAHSGLVYSSIGGEEQLPCDVYQALGIFYRLVPDWWIVQVIAGTRGDLDASLSWLQKANACAPNRIRNLKELAVTELCIGTRRDDPAMLQAGRDHIAAYLALPAKTETEKVDHEHGRMLLHDPSIACGYSRDGLQELDRSKLEGAGG